MQTSTNSEYISCLSLLHIEALQRRGLTNATIDAAGFRSLTSQEVLDVLKFNLNKSAGLGIPFLHPVTGETRMVRVRPDIAPLIDGKPAKYLSPKGAGNLLYFPSGCADRLKDPAEPLYLTEGEFKALAAWQAGLLTVGLIGVSGWRGKGLNGHSGPIPDLDLIAWPDRTAVIVFDSDAGMNLEVQRAQHALAREAYRRGAHIVYAINLPAPNGVKVGWDDYLLAHGVDAFFDLDTEEIPSPDTYQVLPPLSEEEYAALKADIAEHGVLVAVEVDEEGNVLDGHHRVRACQERGIIDYPTIIRTGLSEEEKRAHARRLNLARRHLTREQKRELIRQQLRETPERSDRQIGALMGVDHKTVGAMRKALQTEGEFPSLATIRAALQVSTEFPHPEEPLTLALQVSRALGAELSEGLERATTVPEVVRIHKAASSLTNLWTECKVRIERTLGRLLSELKKETDAKEYARVVTAIGKQEQVA